MLNFPPAKEDDSLPLSLRECNPLNFKTISYSLKLKLFICLLHLGIHPQISVVLNHPKCTIRKGPMSLLVPFYSPIEKEGLSVSLIFSLKKRLGNSRHFSNIRLSWGDFMVDAGFPPKSVPNQDNDPAKSVLRNKYL